MHLDIYRLTNETIRSPKIENFVDIKSLNNRELSESDAS